MARENEQRRGLRERVGGLKESAGEKLGGLRETLGSKAGALAENLGDNGRDVLRGAYEGVQNKADHFKAWRSEKLGGWAQGRVDRVSEKYDEAKKRLDVANGDAEKVSRFFEAQGKEVPAEDQKRIAERIASLEAKAVKLGNKQLDAEGRVRDYKEKRDEAVGKISGRLEKKIEANNEEINRLDVLAEGLEGEIDSRRGLVEDWESVADRLREFMGSFSGEGLREKDMPQVQDMLEEHEKAIEDYKKQLLDLEKAYKDIVDEIHSVERENTGYLEKLDETRELAGTSEWRRVPIKKVEGNVEIPIRKQAVVEKEEDAGERLEEIVGRVQEIEPSEQRLEEYRQAREELAGSKEKEAEVEDLKRSILVNVSELEKRLGVPLLEGMPDLGNNPDKLREFVFKLHGLKVEYDNDPRLPEEKNDEYKEKVYGIFNEFEKSSDGVEEEEETEEKSGGTGKESEKNSWLKGLVEEGGQVAAGIGLGVLDKLHLAKKFRGVEEGGASSGKGFKSRAKRWGGKIGMGVLLPLGLAYILAERGLKKLGRWGLKGASKNKYVAAVVSPLARWMLSWGEKRGGGGQK